MSDVVTFLVNGTLYGAPVEALDGVDPLGEVTPVPGAPAHVRGLTNRRGYMLPVLDLAVLLGLAPRTPNVSLLVTIRAGELIAGLAAEGEPNIVSIAEAEVAPLSESVLIRGIGVSSEAGSEIRLLRPAALLQAAVVRE